MRPTLFLPVENQVRELDAKILFASIAAERGFPVVLGYKQSLHIALPRFERGVFIAKSMRASGKLMFDIITGLGHELLAWDEESLVRYDSPEYYSWRFSPDTFNAIRHLFAWGEDDAEMFDAYPYNRGVKVHKTGNPRADLLRPEVRDYFDPECAALKDRYGDFILINTNFSFTNPFVKRAALVLPDARRTSRTAAGMSPEFAAAMAAHQCVIAEQFRDLMPALARRFPNRTIVVRPHPSEDHDVYLEIAKSHPNIEVCHEGNVIPWLMSAAVMIHNGCTTAVEATLADRPTVAFRPTASESLDYALPNGLSHQTATIDETLGTVADIIGGKLDMIDERVRQRLIGRHLSSSTGDLASERIISALEAIGYGAQHPLPPCSITSRALARTKATVRTTIKKLNMRRHDHAVSSRYEKHRFPALGANDIHARMRRFGAILGRFDSLEVSAVDRLVFRIDARGDPART